MGLVLVAITWTMLTIPTMKSGLWVRVETTTMQRDLQKLVA